MEMPQVEDVAGAAYLSAEAPLFFLDSSLCVYMSQYLTISSFSWSVSRILSVVYRSPRLPARAPMDRGSRPALAVGSFILPRSWLLPVFSLSRSVVCLVAVWVAGGCPAVWVRLVVGPSLWARGSFVRFRCPAAVVLVPSRFGSLAVRWLVLVAWRRQVPSRVPFVSFLFLWARPLLLLFSFLLWVSPRALVSRCCFSRVSVWLRWSFVGSSLCHFYSCV